MKQLTVILSLSLMVWSYTNSGSKSSIERSQPESQLLQKITNSDFKAFVESFAFEKFPFNMSKTPLLAKGEIPEYFHPISEENIKSFINIDEFEPCSYLTGYAIFEDGYIALLYFQKSLSNENNYPILQTYKYDGSKISSIHMGQSYKIVSGTSTISQKIEGMIFFDKTTSLFFTDYLDESPTGSYELTPFTIKPDGEIINPNSSNSTNSKTGDIESDSIVEVEPEFQQLLNLVVDKNIAIPSSLYSLIGIKPERENGEFISLIPIHKLNNTDFVLVVREGLGCTDIICQCMVYLILFRNGNVISKYNFPLDYEEDEFTLLYDIFFIAQATTYEYDGNENDVMSRTNAPPTIIQEYAVILNDKISSLKDLSKGNLRLCRNLIFAHYGYRFKDKNLSEYFSTYEWYKPMYDNVDDKLNDNDKQLIKTIRELEIQMK